MYCTVRGFPGGSVIKNPPETWCRRFLRVPWTRRRSNQSILKELNPEYSLERLMLKLKLQNFGHLMWRADSLEKSLMLWKVGGWRERATEDKMVGWHHWLSEHEFEQALGDSEEQGSLVGCSPWGCKESNTTEWLNWIELKLAEGALQTAEALQINEDTNN